MDTLISEAESNNVESQYQLGMLYLEGKALKKDIQKALAYFVKAAELQHGPSAYKAGQLYEKIGNLINDKMQQMQFQKKSVFYYELAAGLGSIEAKQKLVQNTPPVLIPQDRLAQLPLSFAQQRLWFIEELLPNNSIYNIFSTSKLRGKLNLPALEKSFQSLLSRHEVLRTQFISHSGIANQVIVSPASCPFKLNLVDLQSVPVETQQVELIRICEAEVLKPFRLNKAPLLRGLMIQLAKHEHVLLVCAHHIVSDAWSFEIIARELSIFYNHYAFQQALDLKPLAIQYVDFTIWQRQWLQGDVLDNQLHYWQKQLENIPESLNLPTDKTRPPKLSYQGAIHELKVETAVTQQLRILGEQEQATLFMVFLSALNTLLYRYTHQETIVVGTLIANRHHQEIEELIGFFVNTLALRTDFEDGVTFRQILKQVRKNTLDAYAHQDLPFEQLVEHLQVSRSVNRHPLFQVALVLQNNKPVTFDLQGIAVRPLRIHYPIAKFDLALVIIENEQGHLQLEFEYATDLFEKNTIERMGEHFKCLLAAIVERPDQPITELPLLSTLEKNKLLLEWNQTQTTYPNNKTIFQLFEEQVEKTPENPAVTFSGETLTYRELNHKANQLAYCLRDCGVQAETLVAISVERSLDLLVGLLGILKAGGAYVPLVPHHPPERLKYMLDDTQATILLTQSHLLPQFPDYKNKIVLLDRELFHSKMDNPVILAGPNNLAYVIYTSGSTGKPKGVMVPHGGVVNVLVDLASKTELSAQDTLVAITTIGFDIAGLELYMPLIKGAHIIIAEPRHMLDGEALASLLNDTEATMLQATPATWRLLIDAGWKINNTLKLLSGGEVLPVDIANTLLDKKQKVWNFYGPTETTIWSTSQRIEFKNKVNIGKPLANTKLYILDQHLQPVPQGIAAELYISGIGVTRGYLNRPDLTAEKFIVNPFSTEAERAQGLYSTLYRTGDFARYLPDGDVEYLGRIDQQVKIRGFRIELGEIESVLRQHQEVCDTVVIAQGETYEQQRIVAYVVLYPTSNEAQGQLVNDLKQLLERQLPAYMVPSAFIVLKKIPLNTNGKIDRNALPAADISYRNAQEVYVAPRNDFEQQLVEIWSALLKIKAEHISVQDSFFRLGGHSLLATCLRSSINQVFKVELALHVFFDFPSIQGLAEQIEAATGKALIGMPMISSQLRPRSIPLSFGQERLWFVDQLLPNNSIYNIPLAMTLKGTVQVTALEQSFLSLITRHEILRTRFISHAGIAEQRVIPMSACQFRLSQLDLRAASKTEKKLAISQICEAEALKPFDLSQEPLLRALLLTLDEGEYLLMLCMHHIISDGWSIQIIAKELSQFYNHYAFQQALDLKPLAIQYVDFTIWQRQWLQGDVLDNQLHYWQKQLENIPESLNLPTDKTRPPKLSYQGAIHELKVETAVTQQLRILGEQEQATLFMVFLSALNTLLYRYTHQETIVVGTLIANRHHQEIEELIGFFVNTLALRTDFEDGVTFRQILKQVRKNTLDAYAHQDLPFEQLVEHLQVSRSVNRHPLFQVALVLQNNQLATFTLQGVNTEPLRVNYPIAKFDLALVIIEGEQGDLQFEFEYATDLFDPNTIEKMSKHFEQLLTGIVQYPDQAVAKLPLLTLFEKNSLVLGSHHTPVVYPHKKTIHRLFEEQVAKTPDKIAVVCAESHLTYTQLNQKANQLARYLQDCGVTAETLVGICVERSLDLMVGILGILKAGGAYVPLASDYPKDRLQYMLEDSQTALLLTQSHLVARFDTYKSKIIALDTDTSSQANSHENLPDIAEPNHLAYIIYTSGSTGKPKGVMIPHANVHRLFLSTTELYHFSEKDVWTLFHSYSFDFSVWEIWGALFFGGKLIIVPENTAKNVELFYQLLVAQKVTVLNQTPSAFYALQEYDDLMDDSKQQKLSLKWIIFGGEALQVSRLRNWFSRYGVDCPKLVNMYGITETTVHVTHQHITSLDDNGLGDPLNDLSLFILDQYLAPVPVGITGELYVGGAGLARGYLNQPQLTAERFIENPFPQKELSSRLYRTGDLVRRLSTGALQYIGRQDNQVKIRGYRIELGEIERVLQICSNVKTAAVLLGKEEEGKHLIAYVVLEKKQGQAMPADQAIAQLKRHAQEHLPLFMIPTHYRLLDVMPLTSNGKLDLKLLQNMGGGATNAIAYEQPKTHSEKMLARIWSKVLGVKEIGLYDHYFELGGDSIRSIRVVALARQEGLSLSVADIFQYPVLIRLAAQAQAYFGSETSELEPFSLVQNEEKSKLPAHLEDAYPLTILQSGMLFHSHYTPEHAIYQDTFSYEIKGPWHATGFRLALNSLFQRHELLRTAFELEKHSEPLQYIYKKVDVDMCVLDWKHLPKKEQEIGLKQWFEQEKQQRLSLNHAPLMRFTIHSLSDTHFQFGFTMHHAILDGWSVASMVTELLNDYSTLLEGGDCRVVSPLAIKFRQYVALEIAIRKDKRQIDFWRNYLVDASYLNLPKMIPPSDKIISRRTAASYRMVLDSKLVQLLQATSAQLSVQIKTLFLTAHYRVLAVLGGQNDVMGGYLQNGRLEQLDGDKILGLFLNTVPLRINVSGHSWRELVEKVYKSEQEITNFRRYPLSDIQKINGSKELFEVAFNYVNFHIYQKLATDQIAIVSSTMYEETNFALGITFFGMGADSYGFKIDYDPQLFDQSTIKEYGDYYKRSLEQLVNDVEKDFRNQSILSLDEYHQFLTRWNVPSTRPIKNKTIHQLFEEQVAKTPEHIAIVFKQQKLTYRELNHRSNQLARYIKHQYQVATREEINPDSLIVMCLERSIEMIVSIFGILKAGAVYVPIDPDYPQERIQFILEDTNANIILTQQYLLDKLPVLSKDTCSDQIICLDQEAQKIENYDRSNLALSSFFKDLVYVIYTSGSTGKPKGVMVTHQNLVNSLHARNEFYKTYPKSLLLLQSISVDTANISLCWPLLNGGTLVIPQTDELLDLWALSTLIDENRVDHILCTPLLYNELLDNLSVEDEKHHLSTLKTVILGGEKWPRLLLQTHQSKLPNTYLFNEFGLTEGTVWSSASMVFNVATQSLHNPASIGRPGFNMQLYILDSNLLPVPLGVTGELYIGGVGVAKGYLNRADLTAERFVSNPFVNQEESAEGTNAHLYKTGDLARYFSNGDIEYLGRADNQVKIRGYRIEPGEIEHVIRQTVEVKDVIVVVREDDPGKKQLVAYIVTQDGLLVDEAARKFKENLQQLLGSKLPEYMVPSALVLIDKFPLNQNGKIDNTALPLPEKYPMNAKEARVAARNQIEQTLTEIWSELLKIPVLDLSIYYNFFNCGGDSIISIQLVARARAKGIQLTVKQIFEHPTIAAMAEVANTQRSASMISQKRMTGLIPLTPIQSWFFDMGFADLQHFNQSFLLISSECLDDTYLELALQALVKHHDILNAYYMGDEKNQWQQFIKPEEDEYTICSKLDVSHLHQDEQAKAITDYCTCIQASLNIQQGVLFKAVIFSLGENQPQRLLLAVHHLVVDGVSWRILLEDLAAAYAQIKNQQKLQLPPKSHSYQAWGLALQAFSSSEMLQRQLAYWLSPSASDMAALPVDCNPLTQEEAPAKVCRVVLDNATTLALLQQAPQAYHTQINDILLTALTQTICQWSLRSTLYLYLEGHGRETELVDEHLDLSRTVGWFTSMFPICLKNEHKDIPSILKHIKEQLRDIPDRGIGYGVLRYMTKNNNEKINELRQLPSPQISFNYLGQLDNSVNSNGFRLAPELVGTSVSEKNKDNLLFNINSFIANGTLIIDWSYSVVHYHLATVEGLAERFIKNLSAIIKHCCQDGNFGFTPSDFPLVDLNQDQLDELIGHRDTIEDIYPLTPLQSGLLFRTMYGTPDDSYFVQLAMEITGYLNANILHKAWQVILDHHAVLRTGFFIGGVAEPLQYISKGVVIPWEDYDWQAKTEDEQQKSLDMLMRDERQKLFDLERPPLLRIQLIKNAQDRHYLLFNKHHILSDGWSLPIILKDVFQAYEQLLAQPNVFPCLRQSYKYRDYVAWLQKQESTKVQEFWQLYLKGYTEPTSLVSKIVPDIRQTSAQTEQQHEVCAISVEKTKTLKEFAKLHNITVNTLLQVALALLIKQYTQQEDIVFGVTVSGRTTGLEHQDKMIGLFINTLPLRLKLNPKQPLLALLHDAQKQMVQLNDYSYASLAKIQAWSELGAGQALFDTLFVFENYPLDSATNKDMSGLDVKFMKSMEKVEYPLAIFVTVHEQLECQFSYRTALFNEQHIQRLITHLQVLLQSIVHNPQLCLGEVSSLLPEEKTTLLTTWNQTQAPFPRNKTIHQLFAEQVEKTPDQVALIFEEQALTYQDLNRKANQVAHYLQGLGVTREALVAVCLDRSLDMIVGVLGILKAGAAYVPLDPYYPNERLHYMLEDSQARILLTQSELVGKFDVYQHVIIQLDRDWDKSIAGQLESNPMTSSNADDLIYVIYTSGSTGKPKGVLVEHANVVNCVFAILDSTHVQREDVFLAVTSLSFDVAALDYYLPFALGARVVIANRQAQRDAFEIIRLLEQYAVSVMQATPATWQVLIDADWQNHAPFKMFTAGEALSKYLANQLKKNGELYNIYGPTEAAIYATLSKVNRTDIITIGKPLQNMQTYILDKNLQPVPIGALGELYIGGAGVARGYLNNPILSAEKFIPNPFASLLGTQTEKQARLYKTGDQARYLEDGDIQFLGRFDEQVKIRGFRIELGEIEDALLRHVSVKNAVVTALGPIQSGNKQLVAYIVFHPSMIQGQTTETCIDTLRQALSDRLPDYMMPNYFVPLDEIPLNSNGKLDRAKLPKPELIGLKQNYAAPRTAAEKVLVTVWSKVLGIKNVGIYDNFFSLGGDSIKTIQVVSQIKKTGFFLTPKQIFDSPTIAALSLQINKMHQAVSEQGALSGACGLLPIQHWFFEEKMANINYFNQSQLIQVTGVLQKDRLTRALVKLMMHHDALRFKYHITAEGWTQTYVKDVDLIDIWEADFHQCQDPAYSLEQLALEKQKQLDIQQGKLLSVGIIRGYKDEHDRLFIVVHHLAIDGVSWRILLADLQQLYQGGGALGDKSSSYREWHMALETYARASQADLDYWLEVEKLGQKFSVPVSPNQMSTRQSDSVKLVFTQEWTKQLLQHSSFAYNTQINDLLLSAFALCLKTWTQQQTVVFQLEGHGREEHFFETIVDLSQTVGWCTTQFPVALHIKNGETEHLGQLIQSVKEQLRDIPDKGLSYGVLRYLSPTTEKLILKPHISFNYLGNFDGFGPQENMWQFTEENLGSTTDPLNHSHILLNVNGFIIKEHLQFEFGYSSAHFTQQAIREVAKNFEQALIALIAHCTQQKEQVVTLSDKRLLPLRTEHKPIITLNKDAKKKVVLIHPGHGGAESYFEFCKQFDNTIGFYLIENFERYSKVVFRSIEEIAAYYIEQLSNASIEGPYSLGGWSFGGIIAFEMAQQLQTMQKVVTNLYLIDPILPSGHYQLEKQKGLQEQLKENSLQYYASSWIGEHRSASYQPQSYDGQCEIFLSNRLDPAETQNDPLLHELLQAYTADPNLMNGFKDKLGHYTPHILKTSHSKMLVGKYGVYIAEQIAAEQKNKVVNNVI